MTDESTDQEKGYLEQTTEIVVAYLGNNTVKSGDVAGIIQSVHGCLVTLAADVAATRQRLAPAVPIKKSVTANYVVCLEDGKRLKMLRRHLSVAHGMTPAEYRKKWGLPADHPIVARNYAKQRSRMAKKIGLGKKRPARKTKKKR